MRIGWKERGVVGAWTRPCGPIVLYPVVLERVHSFEHPGSCSRASLRVFGLARFQGSTHPEAMLGRARLRTVQRTRLTLTATTCLRPSPELRLQPDRAAAGLRAGLATLTNDAETRLKGWDELWPLRRPVPLSNPSTIRVHLPSQGSAADVAGGVWRPADALAKELPVVATNPVVGALVNGQPWDLFRPLTHDAEVRILRFDDPAGRAVRVSPALRPTSTSSPSPRLLSSSPPARLPPPFRSSSSVSFLLFLSPSGQLYPQIYWHSAAHLLGAALESVLGAEVRLTDGPPLLDAEGGFFYEMWLANNRRISPDDYEALERAMRPVVKDSERFLRMEVSAAEAAFLFESNPFKREMLAKIPAGERITLYRVGSFVDLCRGPHVPHAGVFKGFSLFKSSGSHWPLPAPGQRGAEVWDDSTRAQVLGDRANDVLLQRIYGVAFPTKPQLDEWKVRGAKVDGPPLPSPTSSAPSSLLSIMFHHCSSSFSCPLFSTLPLSFSRSSFALSA